MACVRVRVELRSYNPHASYEEKEQAFRRMNTAFKKAVADNNILQNCKQHETFESKSRKIRRKKREAELARLKAKLKENFSPQGKYHEK